jgi:hypothetical protein
MRMTMRNAVYQLNRHNVLLTVKDSKNTVTRAQRLRSSQFVFEARILLYC